MLDLPASQLMNGGGLSWLQMLLMLGILAALFATPIITFFLDERRKRRVDADERTDLPR